MEKIPNKKYVLRNGIVVETGTKNARWSADIKIISLPKGYEGAWKIEQHNCLVFGEELYNPLTWTGGGFGEDYDVVKELTK